MSDLLTRRLAVGQLQTNCYLAINRQNLKALIVDPGDDADYISQVIKDEKVTPVAIIATHGHFDHILAANELSLNYQIPFLIHPKDEFLVKKMSQNARFFLKGVVDSPPAMNGYLQDGEEVSLDSMSFKIIETPGHTPGSVSLSCEGERVVFVGDLIFAGGDVGRTDFSYSNQSDLNNSIQKILKLPGETIILSGHGEETSVEQERSFLSKTG